MCPAPNLSRLTFEGLGLLTGKAREAGLSVSTWSLLRWAKTGIRGCKLEAVKIGGRWFTSKPAIERFLTAQNHVEPDGSSDQLRSPRPTTRTILLRHGLEDSEDSR